MTRYYNIEDEAAAQEVWRKNVARKRIPEPIKVTAAFVALPFMLLISPFFCGYQAIKKSGHREKPVPPPQQPFEARDGTRVAQTRSKLLSLAPEIRNMIWTSVMCRHPIVLYRVGERLAYRWLEADGVEHVGVITPRVVENVKKEWQTKTETRGARLNLLAVLQTCQMIYIETLSLLYKSNTFTFLHNQVLSDFCSLALPHHLSSITSVHLHFRFRQTQEHFIAGTYRDRFPPPWDEYTFEKNAKQLVSCLPNLTCLSLFLQGPIIGPYTWTDVMGTVGRLKKQLKDLRSLAIRLPRPAPDLGLSYGASKEAPEVRDGDSCLLFIEPGIKDSRDKDGVDRSDVLEWQLEHETADVDTGRDPGWKIGTTYVPDRNAEDGVARRHYAVEMEDEKQELERW